MAGWMGRAERVEDGAIAAARKVWSAVGAGFFQELVTHLAETLGADLVYVGETRQQPVDRVKTLAVCKSGAPGDRFDYELAGTASRDVLARGMLVHQRGVRRSFPADPTLEWYSAEAFAGQGLFDSTGQPIGLMAALWRHPLDDNSTAPSIMRAFAPRAAAELQRKRDEDSLRESEQRYRVFIAGSPDAMWRIEFEEPVPVDLPEDEQIERLYRYGYVAECNDAMAQMAGVAAAALVGARLRQIAPRTDERIQDLRNVIRSGYKSDAVEIRGRDRSGRPVYRMRSHLGIIEAGKLLRIWVTTRDIGDLRRAELEWRASERRFREILECIRMAAVLVDAEGRITFCNDYLFELAGWSEDEVAGKDWFDLAIPEEDRPRLRAAFSAAIAGTQPDQHFRSALLKQDGTRRLMEWDSTILRDAEGKVVGAASLGSDITDRLALEARLHESQKLESMGRLATGIAHDFNNVLTIVRGYTDLLAQTHESGALQPAVQEMARASEQGAALVRQLLAFGRNQPVQARVLELNAVIRENENMLRRLVGGEVELVLDLDSSAGAVCADPTQLHQVLVNLALNARDAMPGGGRLVVSSKSVEVKDKGAAEMPGIPPGSYVVLSVSDNGTGMTQDVRAHLFEPFFTTKVGRGTGLGLAGVYGIVHQNGGHILVDSEPGKGTTFRIALPAAGQDGAAQAEDAAPVTRGAVAATILVVEDQAALRALAARALRNSGYEVLEAADGQEALSIASLRSEPIDLLLTDLAMPGMEGTELASHLRETRPDLKVLYMSGYIEAPEGEAHIQKPFTIRALQEKVREMVGPPVKL
ncbi:MAG: PAS domain S-box protein [Bryobacteraceae bacterium]